MRFKQYTRLFVQYLRPQWKLIGAMSGLVFGTISLQLFAPQVAKQFIDNVQLNVPLQVLIQTALLYIGVALAQQVISVLATYASETVAWRSTNLLRFDLLAHCLRLDMSFHTAHTSGEMIERIDGDVSVLANFFSQFVILIVGNFLLLIGIVIVLFAINWLAGVTILVFVLIALLTLTSLQNAAVPATIAFRQSNAELFGFLAERLGGTEEIRANGAQAYTMRRFYLLTRQVMKTALKSQWKASVVTSIISILYAIGTAAALAVGAFLFQQTAFSLGTVYLVFQYAALLATPINGITKQVEDWQKAAASLARIKDLTNMPSKIQEPAVPERATLPPGSLAVKFENVSFDYAENEMVLREVSLHLRPGTSLALLGRTGSGKTTLARLLMRLYDPTAGAISVGACPEAPTEASRFIDLRQFSLAELRQRIGLVTQDVQLFHTSLRNNLTLWNPHIPDDQVLQAINRLGLGTWYQSLPAGLDTVLDASGGLSAGEAQLLAFTRIFLRNPGLIILDEASARLDPATEQLLEQVVHKLTQKRTTIIIAHRLKTVMQADEVAIIENGRICEVGAREELANSTTSRFHSLLQTGLEEVLV